MAARPVIGVGIPVWRGAAFVAETIESVLRQRGVSLAVFISIDGADDDSAQACRPFSSDPHVRMVVRTERLGWVGNTAAVLAAALAAGVDYAAVMPHDDLIEDDYFAELLDLAEANPAAAVTYCDLRGFGTSDRLVSQPSVIGTPSDRSLTLLRDHFNAVAYRGLTRASVLRAVPAMAGNPFDDFAADTVWMARLARAGDLVRMPRVLYRKRFHEGATHAIWSKWPESRKLQAWLRHCLDMLAEGLASTTDPHARHRLHAAARARLIQDGCTVCPYRRKILAMTPAARERMIGAFEAAALLLERGERGLTAPRPRSPRAKIPRAPAGR